MAKRDWLETRLREDGDPEEFLRFNLKLKRKDLIHAYAAVEHHNVSDTYEYLKLLIRRDKQELEKQGIKLLPNKYYWPNP